MNNQRINLRHKIQDVKYKKPDKIHNNSTTISFKFSGFELQYLKRLASAEKVSINIYCKNVMLAFIEKEEDNNNHYGQ